MAETDTKVNPPEQAESSAEPKLDKETTEKPTTDEAEGDKSTTETVTDKGSSAASAVKDNVFSMFGGGPKREKREEPDDVDEPSGSSKAEKEKAEAVGLSFYWKFSQTHALTVLSMQDEHPEEHEPDAEFKPVIHLTKKVETKTHEEGEELVFRIQKAKLFRFDREAREWKERGTGEVKLLKHLENGKIRLLMRREKTLKVCANHYGKFCNTLGQSRSVLTRSQSYRR